MYSIFGSPPPSQPHTQSATSKPKSTMSNALITPTQMTARQLSLDSVPQCRFTVDERRRLKEISDELSDLDTLKTRLVELGVTFANNVPVSSEWIADGDQRSAAIKLEIDGESYYAHNRVGPPRIGRRSDVVMEFFRDHAKKFPEKLLKLWTAASEEKTFMGGDIQMSLGRLLLAYPTPAKLALVRPVTSAEAVDAVRMEGIPDLCNSTLPVPPPRRFAATPDTIKKFETDPDSVTIEEMGQMHNRHADNGFPVGGKMCDEDAARLVYKLSVQLLNHFEQRLPATHPYRHDPRELQMRGGGDLTPAELAEIDNSVRQTYEQLMVTDPQFVLTKAKTKADVYKKDKILKGQMRLYAVLPRPCLFVQRLAVSSLPKTNAVQSIRLAVPKGMRQPWLSSVAGSSLAYGGAQDIVDVLDFNLDHCAEHNPRKEIVRGEMAYAHVHVGDDNWLVIRILRQAGTPTQAPVHDMIMAFLDGSNFDISIPDVVAKPIRHVIAQSLMKIHPIGGAFWKHFMSRRLTLLAKKLVVELTHSVLSGGDLVTEVNGCISSIIAERAANGLLDFMLDRRRAALIAGFDRRTHAVSFTSNGRLPMPTTADVESVVAQTGRSVGVTLRCEQLEIFPNCTTVVEALSRSRKTFLGYEFYVEEGPGQLGLD